VVRHELAHIRNRDVDLTYFTVSLWHAFLLGAAVPFALTLLDEGLDTAMRVTWRLGLALAAGFLVGPELALEGTIATGDDALLASLLHGEGVLWVVGLVAALSLLLAWIRATAVVWIRALGQRRSRTITWLALLGATGVLVVVMGIFYVTRDARPVLGVTQELASAEHAAISQLVWALPEWLYHAVTDGLLLWTMLRPEILAALIVIVGLPVAAVLMPGRRGELDGDWAFLDPGGRLSVSMPVPAPARAVVVGLAGGFVSLAALAILRFGIHVGIDEETRPQLAFLFAFFAWQLALALAVQAGTAAVAASMSAGQRVLDGLLAALVAGSIAWFGIIAGPAVGGCVDRLSVNSGPCSWDVEGSFAFDTYRRVVEEGALAALGAALLASCVVALRDRARKGAATPARAAAAS
jgi:hypothetical protein